MKLAAVFVAIATLASSGFQGTLPLRAGVFTSGLQAPVAFVADHSLKKRAGRAIARSANGLATP